MALIDPYSGFAAHFFLEEFISDEIHSGFVHDQKTGKSTPENFNDLLSFFEKVIPNPYKTGLLDIQKELKNGFGIQNLIRQLEIKYSLSKESLLTSLPKIREDIQAFYVASDYENKSFHFIGGYWNRDEKHGHAIGWTFWPEGVMLTNSGEG